MPTIVTVCITIDGCILGMAEGDTDGAYNNMNKSLPRVQKQ
jgi:hypothetical protein